MVGVAGRSKSCKTCKQRKTACSQERPHCTTCVKSKRGCAGYHNDRIFILDQRTSSSSELATEHRKSRSSPAKKNRINKNLVPIETVTEFETIKFSKLAAPDRITAEQILSPQSRSLESSIPTKSAFKILWEIASPSIRSMYRQQILGEFLHIYLSKAKTSSEVRTLKQREAASGNWLSMLPSLPNMTTALEAAVLAISTAKLGRAHSDSNLVRESLKFYIQAMWELQKALLDPKLMHRDGTLAACLLLIMYEVLECPDEKVDAWLRHTRGCAILFEARGPEAYTSEFEHQLFLTFRQVEIQRAIMERRSTFLSNPEWISLPWQGFKKPIASDLLDLTASMANIVESGYKLLYRTAMPLDSPEALLLPSLEIVDQCWKLDVRLQAWYTRLEKEISGPVYWPELSTGVCLVEDPDLGNVFPVAFHFSDLKIAHVCMLYWATFSILWSGMASLYQVMERFHPSDGSGDCSRTFRASQLPPLEHRKDVTALGKNICQSIKFCIDDQVGGFRPVSVVFPLKVAIEALQCGPNFVRELAWAEAAMKHISGSGVRILSHLDVPLTDRVFLPG